MSDKDKRSGRLRPAAGKAGIRRRGASPTLARLIAARVLERVERVRSYADLALHHALAQSNMPSEDRALATELVYGTLRWRGRIDHALGQALDRGMSELEPLVVTTLRIGAYQILFSDRIPDSAAVDEAVRCARALGAERASGLVNAVLRRISREREQLTFPELEADPKAHLVHALSIPEWIAERWLADHGPEAAAALARASNDPPPLAIRVNRKRTSRDALLEEVRERFPDAAPCKISPWGIVLGRRGNAAVDPHFLAGDFTVQDEASQLIVDLLDPAPGDRVLDTCSAPGTKTTAIAEALGDDGRVLALDRHTQRLGLVARSVRRLGLTGVSTLQRDATKSLLDLPPEAGRAAPEGGARFDRVLVDAPCSGLGSLRRNPDARWRVRPNDPGKLARVQAAILDRAAEVVVPGGRLVYSTCTILSEENEDVVQRFLESHPDFRQSTPAELPPHLAPVLDERGFLRCMPHLQDADGFFGASLERVADPSSDDARDARTDARKTTLTAARDNTDDGDRR